MVWKMYNYFYSIPYSKYVPIKELGSFDIFQAYFLANVIPFT